MHSSIPLAAGAVLAALCLHVPAVSTPTPTPPPPADGHLVLLVDGDVTKLDILFAVAKPDAWGGVPKGLASDWQLVVRAADDGELARVPLDLRSFDLDPTHVGKAVQVTGCVVRSPHVALLVNAPHHRGAARYTFEHAGAAVGEVGGDTIEQMAANGGGR